LSISTLSSADALAENGPFAQELPDFYPRPSQQQMATEIESVIRDDGILVAESGTGTGKTYAYLVPALLSGKRVLISTGTRHLQDQLYRRDLPRVMHTLGVNVAAALLKGRANYLCIYRMEQAELEARFGDRKQSFHFLQIKQWSESTLSGDISELAGVPEDSPVWYWVTSTTDNCLGSKCGHYDDCHVVRARQRALEADIVVVNHHLFFADMAVKEEGFGELLPGVEVAIFDEAHQLADVASNFFGVSISANQINALARDTVVEELRERSQIKELNSAADMLQKACADFRLAFGEQVSRSAWRNIRSRPAVKEALSGLVVRLNDLQLLLNKASAKGTGLANCHRRAVELGICLKSFTGQETESEFISWYETSKRGFVLRKTPVDISQQFSANMEQVQRAWVFTSATLAIDNNLDYFCRQLGLSNAITRKWDSPFNYQTNSLLYLPENIPEPNAPEFLSAFLDAVIPVLEASAGRAFVLVTSYRMLNALAQQLGDCIGFPLLVQGQAPRARLLQEFRETANAVLLGTGSFWEGVDVQGEALSCVIIDKLPFAAPDDPVIQARSKALTESGRNAFMEFHVPSAVVSLKQGAGRLIRSETDRGVLMITDRRLVSKGYGRVFLRSLPAMPQTAKLMDVRKFFSLQPLAD